MRLNIFRNVVFLFLVLICGALFYMQIIKGEHYYNQSVSNRIRIVPVDAPRGRILDRNGLVLADNRGSYHAAVIPQDIEDKEELFGFLGKVLKKEPKALEKIFNKRRITPFEPVVVAEDVDRNAVIAIEENRFQYPGLVIEENFERFYPFGAAGAHAVGYVGKIDPDQAAIFQEYGYTPLTLVGKTGVEKFYESAVEGVPGGRQIEVNNRGQEVRLLGLKESVKGKDITLTVDQRIQTFGMELLNGQRGSIVVMDISNGDVLGLVSSPTFDPNVFTDRSQQGKVSGYMQDKFSPLLNRAVSGQYPPGSVFKIPVALAALEKEKITPNTTYTCPGYYNLGSARFGCAHVHDDENLLDAIAHSCNVYFYQIGQLVTAPIIGAYAKAFGLGRPTGIDLPSEAAGKIVMPSTKKDKWFTGNTLNLSIGQGETLTTPIQLTVMTAAVASDGIILQPRLLRAINDKILSDPDLSKRPIIRLKDSTWRRAQEGMRMTITDREGTANILNDLNGLKVWGKTGTAQAGKGKENHAWFAGYVRSSKSNLAFCVFLEHGGSSANAVAITRDLLLRLQSYDVI
jgi:penicillin-binding protein 2